MIEYRNSIRFRWPQHRLANEHERVIIRQWKTESTESFTETGRSSLVGITKAPLVE
jgi:hypothetical protein